MSKSPYMHELEGIAYETGYEDGAAVAFGVMGMAEAIKSKCCRWCGEHERPGPYVCKHENE